MLSVQVFSHQSKSSSSPCGQHLYLHCRVDWSNDLPRPFLLASFLPAYHDQQHFEKPFLHRSRECPLRAHQPAQLLLVSAHPILLLGYSGSELP